MTLQSRGHRVVGVAARNARWAGLAVLVLAGLAGSPAWASGGAGPSSHHELPLPGLALGLTVLGAAGLGAAMGAGGRRRIVLGGLTVLVAVSGIETAVHSVHHFGDADGAASCALLGAAEHVPAALGDAPDHATPGWTAAPAPPIDRESPRPLRAFRSHEGRAPPTAASA